MECSDSSPSAQECTDLPRAGDAPPRLTAQGGRGAPLRVGLSARWGWGWGWARALERTKDTGRPYRCDAQRSIPSPPCSPQIQRARVLAHTAMHSRERGLHTRAHTHCSGGEYRMKSPSLKGKNKKRHNRLSGAALKSQSSSILKFYSLSPFPNNMILKRG